jgi:hypothetical protein
MFLDAASIGDLLSQQYFYYFNLKINYKNMKTPSGKNKP